MFYKKYIFYIIFCFLYNLLFFQVSQVTSGPRRGPTFNNRWWNDRREWNLRTTNSREKASPKGANHIQSCSCSPPSGTIREHLSLSAGSIPFGHSTRGYSHSPPSGTVECYLRNFSYFLYKKSMRPGVGRMPFIYIYFNFYFLTNYFLIIFLLSPLVYFTMYTWPLCMLVTC